MRYEGKKTRIWKKISPPTLEEKKGLPILQKDAAGRRIFQQLRGADPRKREDCSLELEVQGEGKIRVTGEDGGFPMGKIPRFWGEKGQPRGEIPTSPPQGKERSFLFSKKNRNAFEQRGGHPF